MGRGKPTLVLTRRRDQGIVIGPPDNPIARVFVVKIDPRGRLVQLGVEAAASVPVNRDEIAVLKLIEAQSAIMGGG